MTGAWARANPDLVARMLHAGHRLINHSETHPSFTGRSTGSPSLSVDQRAAEIRRAEQAVAAVSGSETTMRPYFRPLYGDYDEALLTLLPELGYSVVVMWTVDSLGWRGIPPKRSSRAFWRQHNRVPSCSFMSVHSRPMPLHSRS
jgi:peptidoglycan/xylan/chitin deacetylase (PgdA/CDA1 family)